MSKRIPSIYRNGQKIENTKQGDTSKKTCTTKHQVTVTNKMEKGVIFWEDMPTTNIWYRFMKTDDQKLAVFDGNQIPKRDTILESFSTKFNTQAPWRT